jgi:hypothetical protein
MRLCQKCNIEKDEKIFYVRSDSGKLRGECIDCTKIYKQHVVKKYYEKYYIRRKTYREKEENRQRRRLYEKNRRKDPCQRIKDALRTRLNSTIKRNIKSGSFIRDLGCSVEFLKQYLSHKILYQQYSIFFYYVEILHLFVLNNNEK